jgi:hypothetical protein
MMTTISVSRAGLGPRRDCAIENNFVPVARSADNFRRNTRVAVLVLAVRELRAHRDARQLEVKN